MCHRHWLRWLDFWILRSQYWKIGRCLQRLPKERARIRCSVEITENCCSRFRTAVTKPHAYVGMMGSRKRSFLMKKDLVQEGFSEELAESLHAPIGLSIGAQTPAEIALSVISEIVKVRSEQSKETTLDEQVLEILSRTPEPGEQRVLCTIIEKHGSAPRSAGTQMVVTSMNQITGTIGGGCAEAEVITACREHFYKLREQIPHAACEKRQIRMSTDNAEEEGMVCGGTIVVLLEEI